MIAKYPGRCAECGGRIEPGDEVERSRETNEIRDGYHRVIRTVALGWQHVTCPPDTIDPTDLTGHGELCGQCFTYHRGECA